MLATRANATKVYSSKDYKHYTKTTQTAEYDDECIAVKLIVDRYNKAIEYERDIIDRTFLEIYGRTMRVTNSKVGEIYVRLKETSLRIGEPLTEVCTKLRKAFGEHLTFMKEVEGRKIPINVETIVEAYEMMKAHKNLMEIQKTLFK